MSNWDLRRIKELGTIITGKTPPTSEATYYGEQYMFATPTDLSYDTFHLQEVERRLSKEARRKFKNQFLPVNAIMYTSIASIGKIGITSEVTLTNQQINSIVVNKNNNPYFLYYSLKMATPYFQAISGGVATPIVNKNTFENTKIFVPNLPTQERIAKILSTYDDLIEANNRRIELLEQTAQELYKEWFVRFRFPGHENTKFENGLPEGWELKKIGDIARVKSGYAFKSEWWIDDGVPVIKIKDIQGNTIDFSDLSYISVDHAEIAKQFYVDEGDLLIAMTGATIGKLALVPYSEKQMIVNQRVGKFFLGESPDEKVAFLYMTLQQNWVQEMIVMIAGSNAAQPNISPFDIEKIKVVYNEDMVDEYNRRSAPFIEEILQLRKQNQNLATQRDMLLPRLMSGKLEV